MIYLKVFETFEEGDFFEEITLSDFNKIIHPESVLNKNNLIKLTQSEIDYLSKFSTGHGRGRWVCDFNFGEYGTRSYMFVQLYKTFDEWYYVIAASLYHGKRYSYFKCDQLQGVEKLFQRWYTPKNKKK